VDGIEASKRAAELVDDASRLPGETKPRGHGRPPGSGRKPGQRNRRSLDAAAAISPLVPKARRALNRLLTADSIDPETRLKAVALTYAYRWGKPTERSEVSGPHGAPIESRHQSDVPLDDAARAAVQALALARGGT